MKKTIILSVTLCLTTLVSCKEASKEDTTTQQEMTVKDVIANSSDLQNANTQGAGLNPEHGMLGHRCDIPVGASLDTPLQGENQNNAPATPVLMNNNANKAFLQEGESVKANPEHGQPGHRCDIPVGAPL
ncbi:MAG: hypothetical protein ACRCVU_17655 [Flavobacterium sp.]